MAIARVQSKAANSTTQNTTVTFDSAATANNLLVLAFCGVGAGGGGSGVPTAYTSTGWAQAVGDPFSAPYQAGIMWKIAAGGETGVTFASNKTSGNFNSFVMAEYSGTKTSAPVDVFANDGSASAVGVTSRATGTTGTTSENDELAIVVVGHGNTVTSLSWTNSFTTYNSSAQAGSGVYLGDKILTTTGTQTSTASWTTSRAAGGCIATFLAAAAAAATNYQPGFRFAFT